MFCCSHSLLISCQPEYGKLGICDITDCHKSRVEIFLLHVEKKNVLHALPETKKNPQTSVIYHIERPACPKNFKQRLIVSD